MTDHKTRIQTLRTILTGSREIGLSTKLPIIIGEFENVVAANKLNDEKKKMLLQILFSTRALDTSLKVFIEERCIYLAIPFPSECISIGKYLDWFAKHNRGGALILSSDRKKHFKTKIANERNRYMHGAGEFPRNNAEINTLLAEMEDCLSQVTAFSR